MDTQNRAEAQKKEEKKAVSPTPVQAKSKKTANQSASLCPACGANIPEGALFCPECGFNINSPSFCPNCGAETSPGADICPVCKAWLLDGQCKFCYAHLDPQAAFCPDCGNPKDGIQCPDCGALSIFDFCTKCGRPLTEGALLALEAAKNDPDAKALIDAIQETVSIENELAELEELIKSAPSDTAPTPAVRKSLFSDSQLSSIIKSGENRDIQAQRKAEAEKRNEEFARKQEEEKRLAAVREAKAKKEALERKKQKALEAAAEAQMKFKNKTFLTHQEARRFHNAMKPGGCSGWLCNYMNVVHTDGPNGCDQPGLGGYWYSGQTTEITMSGPS